MVDSSSESDLGNISDLEQTLTMNSTIKMLNPKKLKRVPICCPTSDRKPRKCKEKIELK